MKFALCLAVVVAVAYAAPQYSLPMDFQPENIMQLLDDPQGAEAVVQCLLDFGSSANIQCPEGLRKASEMAGSLAGAGGCATCTAEDTQLFDSIKAALGQRPEVLQRFVEVLLPRITAGQK